MTKRFLIDNELHLFCSVLQLMLGNRRREGLRFTAPYTTLQTNTIWCVLLSLVLYFNGHGTAFSRPPERFVLAEFKTIDSSGFSPYSPAASSLHDAVWLPALGLKLHFGLWECHLSTVHSTAWTLDHQDFLCVKTRVMWYSPTIDSLRKQASLIGAQVK